MWIYIIINLILSALTIVLLHHLWNYFRDTYTPRRTKDLVGYQTQKYKEMMEDALSPAPPPEPDFLSPDDREQMIQELRELVLAAH